MIKSWQPYARHILDTIAKIRRIAARGDLCQDEVLYDATLRNLQTLSEATQHLPELIKQRHPAIPWKQISGFRNILVHDYLGRIDPQTVLGVIEQHLSPPGSGRAGDTRQRKRRHILNLSLRFYLSGINLRQPRC